MCKFRKKNNTNESMQNEVNIGISIKQYKSNVIGMSYNDLKFIKVNRIIYLYLFTLITLAMIVVSYCLVTGKIDIGDEKAPVYIFVGGMFVQLFGLMVIVFRYLFDPVKSLLEHTMTLILDEKTPSPNESKSDDDLSEVESASDEGRN